MFAILSSLFKKTQRRRNDSLVRHLTIQPLELRCMFSANPLISFELDLQLVSQLVGESAFVFEAAKANANRTAGAEQRSQAQPPQREFRGPGRDVRSFEPTSLSNFSPPPPAIVFQFRLDAPTAPLTSTPSAPITAQQSVPLQRSVASASEETIVPAALLNSPSVIGSVRASTPPIQTQTMSSSQMIVPTEFAGPSVFKDQKEEFDRPSTSPLQLEIEDVRGAGLLDDASSMQIKLRSLEETLDSLAIVRQWRKNAAEDLSVDRQPSKITARDSHQKHSPDVLELILLQPTSFTSDSGHRWLRKSFDAGTVTLSGWNGGVGMNRVFDFGGDESSFAEISLAMQHSNVREQATEKAARQAAIQEESAEPSAIMYWWPAGLVVAAMSYLLRRKSQKAQKLNIIFTLARRR